MKVMRTEQVTVNLDVQRQIVHIDNELAKTREEMQIINNNVNTCHQALTTLSDSVYNDMQAVSDSVRVVRNENDEKVDTVMTRLKDQLQKTIVR